MFKKDKYKMDMRIADETLQNVFKACDKQPNTIPFDKLVLKGIARTRLNRICKYITFIVLFLLIIAPMAFTDSDFIVKNQWTSNVLINDHELYSNVFMMNITGNSIVTEGICARKSDGSIIFPSEIINSSTNSYIVNFVYDGQSLNIMIPTENGEALQCYLSEREK